MYDDARQVSSPCVSTMSAMSMSNSSSIQALLRLSGATSPHEDDRGDQGDQGDTLGVLEGVDLSQGEEEEEDNVNPPKSRSVYGDFWKNIRNF